MADRKDVLEFINRNPVFLLATVEEGAPRVRSLMLHRADTHGIVFATSRAKDLHRQLAANPRVEMCFLDSAAGDQVRVSGVVEALADESIKADIVRENPFLKPWIEKEGYAAMVVYRLQRGLAISWTMQSHFKPKNYIEL